MILDTNIRKSLYSYLIGRSQRVVIGNSISESIPITSVVPYGGQLEPIWFLLNDVKDVIEFSNLSMFADDIIINNYNKLDENVKDLDHMNKSVIKI